MAKKKAELQPRIVGTAYSVPKKIRKNNDPIFKWLIDNPPPNNPFAGYVERRVLQEHEDVVTLMIDASRKALSSAKMKTRDVDFILGAASIGKFRNPNQLSQVHRDLNLRQDCWAIPVTNDFSNFNAALVIATALILAGRAKTILIVNGSSWTRNVDYHTGQSASAGDGAGAAIVSLSDDPSKFFVKDDETLMATQYFGGMYSTGTPVITSDNTVLADGHAPAVGEFSPYPKNDALYKPLGYDTLYTHHYFTINDLGMEGFKNFAIPLAANSALTVMNRNNLKGKDICYLPHQSTQVLIDVWNKAIKPAQELDTIKIFGNLGVATEAVNFAYASEKKLIKKDNVILMAMGDDIHVNSILLQRF